MYEFKIFRCDNVAEFVWEAVEAHRETEISMGRVDLLLGYREFYCKGNC